MGGSITGIIPLDVYIPTSAKNITLLMESECGPVKMKVPVNLDFLSFKEAVEIALRDIETEYDSCSLALRLLEKALAENGSEMGKTYAMVLRRLFSSRDCSGVLHALRCLGILEESGIPRE